MNKRLQYFLLIFTILFSSNMFSQTFDVNIANKLQFKIDSLKNEYNIKGISASVYYPNQGLWQGVSGISEGTTAITTDMEFGIASNTKLFTAVAILKLEENNILNINDSLHQWLPPLNNIDSNIQIKQLLNHTSGIFDFTTITSYADSIMTNPNKVFTPSEVIGWVEPSLFPAGTNTSYSSSNYVLAGMIVENASSQSLEHFIRDSILIPNALNNTFFPISETVVGNIAHPWQNGIDISTTPRISLLSAAWSAGAIYSTSEDMNNWYRYLFSNRILNSNSITEMTTFPGAYGLGIGNLNLIPGRTVYGHGGDIRGYRSMMLYDVQTEAVVCVLINQNPAPAPLVAKVLLETLIYETFILGISNFDKNYEIKIYPNPTNGQLIIQPKINYQELEITIFTISGKKLLTVNNQTKVDISNLTSGTYIITIKTDEEKAMKKIIKIE